MSESDERLSIDVRESFEVAPERVLTRKGDSKGRIAMGPETADKVLRVAILEIEDSDD